MNDEPMKSLRLVFLTFLWWERMQANLCGTLAVIQTWEGGLYCTDFAHILQRPILPMLSRLIEERNPVLHSVLLTLFAPHFEQGVSNSWMMDDGNDGWDMYG